MDEAILVKRYELSGISSQIFREVRPKLNEFKSIDEMIIYCRELIFQYTSDASMDDITMIATGVAILITINDSLEKGVIPTFLHEDVNLLDMEYKILANWGKIIGDLSSFTDLLESKGFSRKNISEMLLACGYEIIVNELISSGNYSKIEHKVC